MSFSLEDVPTYFSDVLGTTEIIGQLVVSSIVLFAFLLPTLILTKNSTTHFVVMFLSLSICVGLGWLPFWFEIIIVLLVALAYAKVSSNIVSGG